MDTTIVFSYGKSYDIKEYVHHILNEQFFSVSIGINEYVYERNNTGVKTYVFSASLNPLKNYPISFMNKGFLDLISKASGGLFWKDKDFRILYFPKYIENKKNIIWGSLMNFFDDNLLSEHKNLLDVANLILRIEHHEKNVNNNTNPQIVITFENCFESPIEISPIKTNFNNILDINTLPFIIIPFDEVRE